MQYWLMKSEPEEFSFEDLKTRPDRKEPWDGVRNYQARNMMRDEMKVGDGVLFYHSNCDVPGVVGLAKIASEPRPDHTAFDPEDKHFDPKSDPDNPRWFLVDVQYDRPLKRVLPLAELKDHADALDGLALIRRGNRLSVMPVSAEHWDYILGLESTESPTG
ncbi:EVE domain-containing protein [uncultured Abyssibacter sp.]|uniref:EVE domain-containing protein n=1 Tax=uncultured Abyssibacter sp. TaxID=2320202 RepID=UPI0032B224F7